MAALAGKPVMAVTGANKGIGYEVARRLLSDHPDATVLVTSRNEVRRERRAVGRTPGGAPLFPSLSFFAPCQQGRLLAFLTPCVLTSLLLCLACCPSPVPHVPASLRRPVCPFLPCWPPPSFDPFLRPLPDSPAVPPCALAIGRSEARLPLAPWTTPTLSTCPWTWPTRRPSRPGLGELRQSTGGWTCWSLMRASWDGAHPTPVSR